MWYLTVAGLLNRRAAMSLLDEPTGGHLGAAGSLGRQAGGRLRVVPAAATGRTADARGLGRRRPAVLQLGDGFPVGVLGMIAFIGQGLAGRRAQRPCRPLGRLIPRLRCLVILWAYQGMTTPEAAGFRAKSTG